MRTSSLQQLDDRGQIILFLLRELLPPVVKGIGYSPKRIILYSFEGIANFANEGHGKILRQPAATDGDAFFRLQKSAFCPLVHEDAVNAVH